MESFTVFKRPACYWTVRDQFLQLNSTEIFLFYSEIEFHKVTKAGLELKILRLLPLK